MEKLYLKQHYYLVKKILLFVFYLNLDSKFICIKNPTSYTATTRKLLIHEISSIYSQAPLFLSTSNFIFIFFLSFFFFMFFVINPLASPSAGAPALKYGDVNTETTSHGEVKGLINLKVKIYYLGNFEDLIKLFGLFL